jgi:hypothetical protein
MLHVSLFFETGQLESSRRDLSLVTAMSIGDSLCVSGSIVDDPATSNHGVYSVLGSLEGWSLAIDTAG